MKAQSKSRVSYAEDTNTDPTKMPRKESMKQPHSIQLDIRSSQRNSLKVKSCPQQKSAFEYHLMPAYFQLAIWGSVTDALVNHLLDPLEYGWELEDGNLIGKMSSRDIAPLEVVELVACKCKGNLNLKLHTKYP